MGLSTLIGDFRLYLPSLTIGGTGCVDGPLGIAPQMWVEIKRAYEAGDIARAVAAQKKATETFDILLQVEYLAGMKAMVSDLIGMDCGDPRPPLAPLRPGQREVIKKAVEQLGLGKATKR
ncbi:MAG: hypothetical protein FJ319_01915 [SAR202 cluster bacterium]|nr:hypothetical protein [SAR202 cluster bacterium]